MKPMHLLDFVLLAAQHVMRPAPPSVQPVPLPASPIHLPDGKREMVDKAKFFAGVRRITGPLDQVQVDTINRLLVAANHHPASWLAYELATAWHECRLRPIAEIGKGRGRKYGKVGKYGQVPYGRGLVQLTWDFNYEWADAALDLGGRLLRNFDLALDPAIATRIMVLGMETGAFTGKSLKNYLSGEWATRAQFVPARYIINGKDKREKIADYAVKFQDWAIRLGKWED